ncbi:MAG: nucleoside kinase [Lachnospiraceae bacterium]|nr:nucleoside kinase [Lachnospiraceae bacterium]
MKVTVKEKEFEKEYSDNITFEEVINDLKDRYEDDVVLAYQKGKLRELNKKVKPEGDISFVTTADQNGQRTYRRSVIFLMQRALMDVVDEKDRDVRVEYSIGQGFYCRLTSGKKLTEEELKKLYDRMCELRDLDLPFKKTTMKTDEARAIFREEGMNEKDRLLRYRSASNVNIYELDGLFDYFFGYMVPSAGYLKYFEVHDYDDGFVLQFPDNKKTKEVYPFHPAKKLFNVLKLSNEWSDTMEIGTVGALNDAIAAGRGDGIVRMQEALMEARIGQIAEEILSDSSRKFVMIAGPSSSGKTTFSHRLSTQLAARGVHPHPVALDDYYLNRDQIPLDEFGEKDFEAIEGLDIDQFNTDMEKLLAGERVLIPSFNFKIGKREYRDHYLQLGKNDILVIEGIHGLNDRMSERLPKESKFKVYISALTQLSIDEHNPLSTSDGRLIRRIVRDARTRGYSAQGTIGMWDSVRRGERKNIFPFQEEADTMFNSALIYEMSVLKQYALPLLYGIEPDAPEYSEAKRLIKLFDYFLPIPSEIINNNSLVREFIGGSCFNV